VFLNEVRNHAFGVWAGGAPTNYSTQLTNTTLVQLNQSDLRGHPNRVATETYGKGSLGQGYIYERPSSLRANIAAAASIDAFRIWPFSGDAGNAFNVAHVGPFRVVTGTNDVILFSEDGGATILTATLAAGFYSATTLATQIDTQLTAAGGSAFTITWDGINRGFTIVSNGAGGGGTLDIYWTTSTAGAFLGYTADDTGALTYTSDAPAPAGLNSLYRAFEGKTHALSIAARCQTAGNVLRVRVVGLDENYVISTYLNANGRWQAAAASVNSFRLSGMWRRYGLTFEAPPTVRYFLWQVSNGTAGAQLLDLGNVWWQNPMWQQGQEEARV
jgi:hypothetical protein